LEIKGKKRRNLKKWEDGRIKKKTKRGKERKKENKANEGKERVGFMPIETERMKGREGITRTRERKEEKIRTDKRKQKGKKEKKTQMIKKETRKVVENVGKSQAEKKKFINNQFQIKSRQGRKRGKKQ
jgi:hypothetical protein